MLFKIDTFILERIFTPIAWWFERTTGRTNFYLAWWLLGLCILLLGFLVNLGLKNLPQGAEFFSNGPMFIMAFGTFLAATILRMYSNARDEERVRSGQIVGQKFSWLDLFVRISMVTLLIADASLSGATLSGLLPAGKYARWPLLQHGFELCYVSALYLSAVKRPPPKPRREKEKAGELQPVLLRS